MTAKCRKHLKQLSTCKGERSKTIHKYTFDTNMSSTSAGCYEHSHMPNIKQMVSVIKQASLAIKPWKPK